MIGQTISHYRIVEKLGEGGMGVVYKAEDLKLGRAVALKFLPSHLTESEEHKARFLHEARAAAQLDHPNICTVHEIDEANGQTFLAMACLEGQTLKQKIAVRPLPLAEALGIALQIGQGLQAAHEKGIVHRDIKPANIMITYQGHVKIMDFGLAQLSNRTKLTETRARLGTPAYMSPEQAEGERADRRTDIWSLGVVLYEMITGRPPFAGEREQAVLYAILNEDPDPPTALRSGLPIELDGVLGKALAKDREQRYQHVDELLVDLKRAPEAVLGRVSAGRAAPGHSGRSRTRGRRMVFAAVAAMIVVVAWWVSRRAGEPRSSIANATFTQLTDAPGKEFYPSLSPRGDSFAYASPASGNWDIYFQRLGGRNSINLTNDSSFDDTQPAFSPTGDLIAFRSEREGGGIFIMGATGESVRQVTDFGYNPAWSPDGKHIVCSTATFARPDYRQSYTGQLFSVDLSSGERRLISQQIADSVQPHWSPHGHRIAYWALRGGIRDIWTVAAGGGDPVPVTADPHFDWNPVWSVDGNYLYFASDRGGTMNLWRVPIDEYSGSVSKKPEPVTTPSTFANHLSFAQDGRRAIYVQQTRTVNLHRIAFDSARGSTSGPIVPVTQGTRETMFPDASPGGKWIAYNSGGTPEQIFIIGTDGSNLKQLTNDNYKNFGPRWSADGKYLSFFSNRGSAYQIWTMNSSGSELRQLTYFSEGDAIYPVWSPDARQIAASTPQGGKAFIAQVQKDGSGRSLHELPLLDESSTWFVPSSWSTDGKKLAGYQQRRDGSYSGVLVYDVETDEYQRLSDFGTFPVWMADGRRLLFHHQGKIHLLDGNSRGVQEVLSASPHEIEWRFALSADNNWIYFSPESNEADIWLMTFD